MCDMDDKLMQMAKQAGLTVKPNTGLSVLGTIEELEALAAMIRADERERCAKVCDAKETEFQYDSEKYDCQEDTSYLCRKWGAKECAAAIRAMENGNG